MKFVEEEIKMNMIKVKTINTKTVAINATGFGQALIGGGSSN